MQQVSYRESLVIQRVLSGRERGFHYSTDLKTVAANGSGVGSTQIEAAADFVAESVTTVVISSSTNRVIDFRADAPPRIVIQKDSSSSDIMNREDNPLENISGSALFPYVFRVPLVFKASQTISVTFVNVSTTTSYALQTTFHGYKIMRGR